MRTTPLGPSRHHNEIDERARTWAQKVLDGSVEPEEGRWKLMELAQLSTVIDDCARTAMYGKPQGGAYIEMQDLKDRYLDMLTDKVLGKPGVTGIDLQRIADGDSFCGWMHQLLTNSTRFHLLRHRREFNTRGKHEHLMPLHSSETGAGNFTAGIDALPGAIHNHDDELFAPAMADVEAEQRVTSVLAGLLADRTALRGDTLLIRQARSACRGLGLRAPLPVTWRRLQVRDRIAAFLDRTEDEDLVAILESFGEGTTPPPGSMRQFTYLWAEHSPAELDRVCEFGGSVIRLLTRAAITPVPQPRQASVKMLTARALARVQMWSSRGSVSEQVSNWALVVSSEDGSEQAAEPTKLPSYLSRLVAGTVAAWADSVSEMSGSQWSSSTPRQRTREEMEEAQSAFVSAATLLLNSSEESLGASPEEIAESLAELFAEVEDDRLTKREAEVYAAQQ